MYCATGLVTCLPRDSRINKYVFVSASCADKLDGFFAEVAYKGKFVYKHTVDILASESLLLIISLNLLVTLIQIFAPIHSPFSLTFYICDL